MNRAGRTGLTLAAVLAAGAGGFWAGQRNPELPAIPWLQAVPWLEGVAAPPKSANPAPTGPVIYYRDPDGLPAYAATPKKTVDGRDFLPVLAGEDLNFEDKPPAAAATVAANGEPKRILYYRNPMGLPDTSPAPKKDSMGMDYIPVYAGEDDDASTVKVATGKLQRTGVRSEVATEQVIVRPVRVPGTVQLDERRVSVVATRTDAFVDKVADVTTGDRVKKGEPLMRLYSAEIAAASAQYLTDLNGGGRASAGARQRLENLALPPDVIAAIDRTRQVQTSITWTAPRDGVILERNVVEGMKASPGDVLFRLADVSTVWIVADVPEYQLGAVKVGAAATMRVRSLPGRTFSGRVALIYPQVSKETRTTKVRIEIPNPDGLLLPDMYADVEIGSGSNAPVVAVPDSAVIDTGTRQVVILDKGEGRFEPREVKIGLQGGGFTEIRNGVATGDRVVVSANFLIDAESNLKAALSGMTSPETAP
ncbi:efflux RND transporter periplasmic adaptor subunit [Mesorhizobium sp. YC-39]|uniref:efflux RND transporter periplasmic adaptor subunit n=1 Tax=unclassified Mesorhizobium TaxID=325217 RepID=UPI0021E7550A|nr:MULTISPECIES: efflux RND transporter periplasmic adaptor subunit [unclassified Mesorhizobium]MCV3208348.1 efflux RND transporter periplasmic adaptor subunit [Mesorhizobium sp. YC-2]MCV3232302.1 efflux RND transporter periplasmic adaptor subunit [Mesorhizobium sp. YC-39]